MSIDRYAPAGPEDSAEWPGAAAFVKKPVCLTCEGSGTITVFFDEWEYCPDCHGTGNAPAEDPHVESDRRCDDREGK